ncbi:hypothetical protein BLA29_008603, partial [Euroglyphus maynei]
MNPSSFIDRDLLKKLSEQSTIYQSCPFWPNDRDKFNRLTELWKISAKYDWKDTWAIQHENKYYFTLNTISNYTIGQKIRSFFGLNRGNVALFSTIVPCLAFSNILGTAIHFVFVTSPIIDRPIDNHRKQIFVSTLTHLTTSVLYPILFITGSSLYYATKYVTQPIPDDMGLLPESRKYVWEKFIKQSFMKNRYSFLMFTIINVIVASTLTTIQ